MSLHALKNVAGRLNRLSGIGKTSSSEKCIARRASAVAAPALIIVPLILIYSALDKNRSQLTPLGKPGVRAVEVSSLINPNTAPWHELAALPGIGEKTARKIASFRSEYCTKTGQPRAFFSSDDLQHVNGIGPATVRRLRPFLSFTD